MRKLSTMLVAVLTAILTLYSCANSDKPADVNNFRIQRGTNVSHWLSQNNEDSGEARRQHIQEDDFARLEIDESEQVSRRYIQLIEFEAALELVDRTGQIPHLCLFKPLIIIEPGQYDRLLLHRHVTAALRTVGGRGQLSAAVHTFHLLTVPLIARGLSKHFLQYVNHIGQVA